MKKEILRFQNGEKISGAISRIHDFTIQIYRDEICGLIIENNVERSSIINILSGEERLDYGWVYFCEECVNWDSYEKILKDNVYIINRESRCIGRMQVRDNILTFLKDVSLVGPLRKNYKKINDIFESIDCGIDLDARTDSLPYYQQKEIELIQAFVSKKKIVILSEMDEFFTEESVPHFFSTVLKLKKMGMDFLIISSNTEVLTKYASYIYFFSRGYVRHCFQRHSYNVGEIHSLLINESRFNANKSISEINGYCALRFDKVTTGLGIELDFAVNKGEIVNFVSDNEIIWKLPMDLLEGNESVKSGKIYVGEENYPLGFFRTTFGSEIGVVAENFSEIEFFLGDSILEYIAIVMSRKGGLHGFSNKHMSSLCEELLATNEFTVQELMTPLYKADAGLIQKAAFYRWILYRPEVLICLRPFTASDYNIKRLTAHLINAAVQNGIAVLILTMSFYEACIMEGRIIGVKSNKTYEIDPDNPLDNMKK